MTNPTSVSRQVSPPQFARRMLAVEGAAIEVAVAGVGDPLLYVCTDDAREDRLAGLLAAQFMLVAVPAEGSDGARLPALQQARHLAAIAQGLGFEAWDLCLRGSGTCAALYLAADRAAGLRRVVLLAPEIFTTGGELREPAPGDRLDDPGVDMLALFGTDAGGDAREEASCYRERLARCHLTFVYDAPDPARDRPEAAASVIADFLKRGEGFLVNNGDGALYP